MTKAMSKDYAPDNILVNTVCVSITKSGQQHRRYEALKKDEPSLTLDAFYERAGANLLLGRVAEAHEVGDVICFLASERASYVAGASLNVDGGAAPMV